MKKLFALMLAALLILSLVACGTGETKETQPEDDDNAAANENVITVKSGKFEYDVNDEGDYEIIDYVPSSPEVIDLLELPRETEDGREIVGVANDAFKAELSIKSVKIPDTYVYIGSYSFYDCDNLESVVMADTVASVGEYAFASCDKLASINISAAWVAISVGTFKDCVALSTLSLPEATVAVKEMAFFGCKELTTLTLSDKIESITKNAFYGCDKLTYTVADNAKYLGNTENPHLVLVSAEDLNVDLCVVNSATKVIAENAFSNCEYLDSLTLNADLKVIKNLCFENCAALEFNEYENARYLGTAENPYMVLCSVIIPSVEDLKVHGDTKIITEEAFANCPNLEDISYEKTTEEWNAIIKTDNWNHDLIIEVICHGDTAAAE